MTLNIKKSSILLKTLKKFMRMTLLTQKLNFRLSVEALLFEINPYGPIVKQ